MTCQKCQKENSTGAQFCKYCGTAIIQQSTVTQEITNNQTMPSADASVKENIMIEQTADSTASVSNPAAKENSTVKAFNKNKKIIVIALIALGILALTIAFIGGNAENKIIGQWEVSAQSQNERLGVYPEENVVFTEDGICHADGYSFNYTISDDTLIIDSLFGGYTYEYQFKGGQLLLKEHSKDADDPWIYYDKVS